MRNDASLAQEQVRQRHRFVERPAGIGAHVEHQPAQASARLALQRLPGCQHVRADIAGEFIDHDVADIAVHQFMRDRLQFDHAARGPDRLPARSLGIERDEDVSRE